MGSNIPLLFIDQVKILQEKQENPPNSDKDFIMDAEDFRDTTATNDEISTFTKDSFTDMKYQLPIFFVLLTVLVILSVIYAIMNTKIFLTRFAKNLKNDNQNEDKDAFKSKRMSEIKLKKNVAMMEKTCHTNQSFVIDIENMKTKDYVNNNQVN